MKQSKKSRINICTEPYAKWQQRESEQNISIDTQFYFSV